MQNTIDLSVARSNTYRYLSQLFLQGPVPEIYAHIEAIPELALALVPPGNDSYSLESLNQDHLAADYYFIFGLLESCNTGIFMVGDFYYVISEIGFHNVADLSDF